MQLRDASIVVMIMNNRLVPEECHAYQVRVPSKVRRFGRLPFGPSWARKAALWHGSRASILSFGGTITGAVADF